MVYFYSLIFFFENRALQRYKLWRHSYMLLILKHLFRIVPTLDTSGRWLLQRFILVSLCFFLSVENVNDEFFTRIIFYVLFGLVPWENCLRFWRNWAHFLVSVRQVNFFFWIFKTDQDSSLGRVCFFIRNNKKY